LIVRDLSTEISRNKLVKARFLTIWPAASMVAKAKGDDSDFGGQI
jgi:hypothetical protein